MPYFYCNTSFLFFELANNDWSTRERRLRKTLGAIAITEAITAEKDFKLGSNNNNENNNYRKRVWKQ